MGGKTRNIGLQLVLQQYCKEYEDCAAPSERRLDCVLHPSHDALRLAGLGQARCYIQSAQITGAPNVNF